MRTCNGKPGALAALMILVPLAVAVAEEQQPYPSATEAYRQGSSALKSGRPDSALPALVYAANRGVLGAQLKLARGYAAGNNLPQDDAKAFFYFQQIANQHADILPSSPVAKYVGEAFVALGKYYVDGVPGMSLAPAPAYAAKLFRHSASYFGNAEAQYRLAHLYLAGDGLEKNIGLAANWLAAAAKKQHVAAQATLGELLWRGVDVRQRRARGLALITLAHENAQAGGREPQWIADLYQECFAASDNATRKEAEALLPELGGAKTEASMASPKARAVEAMPALRADPAAPAAAAPAEAQPLTAPPPAPIGLSVGFGAPASDASGLKP
jgi:exopolysaccharide production negative regulator